MAMHGWPLQEQQWKALNTSRSIAGPAEAKIMSREHPYIAQGPLYNVSIKLLTHHQGPLCNVSITGNNSLTIKVFNGNLFPSVLPMEIRRNAIHSLPMEIRRNAIHSLQAVGFSLRDHRNICTTLVGCMIHWGLYWPWTDKMGVQYSLPHNSEADHST
jgi:hypothetical protein